MTAAERASALPPLPRLASQKPVVSEWRQRFITEWAAVRAAYIRWTLRSSSSRERLSQGVWPYWRCFMVSPERYGGGSRGSWWAVVRGQCGVYRGGGGCSSATSRGRWGSVAR